MWRETNKGGLIMRTGRQQWLARPRNKAGMNSIKGFQTAAAAINYANKEA